VLGYDYPLFDFYPALSLHPSLILHRLGLSLLSSWNLSIDLKPDLPPGDCAWTSCGHV
jgi:hypothetical protein